MPRYKSRHEASQWRGLRDWLARPIWKPVEAAYLIIGIDPDRTRSHPDYFAWLPCSFPKGFEEAPEHALQVHLEEAFATLFRMCGEYAEDHQGLAPSVWLKWSEKRNVTPPWLNAAYHRSSVARLLPSKSMSGRPVVQKKPATLSEVSRKGGHARSRSFDDLKTQVRNEYVNWRHGISDFSGKSKAGFARWMVNKIDSQCDVSSDRSNRRLHAESVTERTILSWIRSFNGKDLEKK